MKRMSYIEFALAAFAVIALFKCVENVVKVGWGGPITFWTPSLLIASVVLICIKRRN